MDTLFARHDRQTKSASLKFIRSYMTRINWTTHLLAIRGARGIGKTTLMLQYIKQNYKALDRQVLYCSLDTVYFSTHTILELADRFYKMGGKHLFLDEVHKYANWSQEIKEVYDAYPDMRIVLSGSSALKLQQGDTDLSRRCVNYDMQGLSFREYLSIYAKIDIPVFLLEDILYHPSDLCAAVYEKCRPLQHFQQYLRYGYYPFYLDNSTDYYTLIDQVASFIIETELPLLCKVDPANTRKIKALLNVLAMNVPYQLDMTKLASMIQVIRTTVQEYLQHLQSARLLNLLYSDLVSVKKMQKPDKIYLENPNLLYALSPVKEPHIGTVRECFAVNQLSASHTVEYGKANGDFKVDNRYVLEIGGENKTFKQIADIPESYILADDIETPSGNKLPLWMLGFLY